MRLLFARRNFVTEQVCTLSERSPAVNGVCSPLTPCIGYPMIIESRTNLGEVFCV